jgi:hypothetical protein
MSIFASTVLRIAVEVCSAASLASAAVCHFCNAAVKAAAASLSCCCAINGIAAAAAAASVTSPTPATPLRSTKRRSGTERRVCAVNSLVPVGRTCLPLLSSRKALKNLKSN